MNLRVRSSMTASPPQGISAPQPGRRRARRVHCRRLGAQYRLRCLRPSRVQQATTRPGSDVCRGRPPRTGRCRRTPSLSPSRCRTPNTRTRSWSSSGRDLNCSNRPSILARPSSHPCILRWRASALCSGGCGGLDGFPDKTGATPDQTQDFRRFRPIAQGCPSPAARFIDAWERRMSTSTP